MREAELPRVEHLALETAATAIHFVAEDGMAEVFEMHANLVRASGVECAFDERTARHFAQHAVVRARGASAFAGPRPCRRLRVWQVLWRVIRFPVGRNPTGRLSGKASIGAKRFVA